MFAQLRQITLTHPRYQFGTSWLATILFMLFSVGWQISFSWITATFWWLAMYNILLAPGKNLVKKNMYILGVHR